MRRTKQTTKTRTRAIPRSRQQNSEFVQTPLAQTIISSTVIAIAIACLCYVFAWSVNIVIVSFGLSLCLIWFYRLHLFDGLLMQLETIVQSDINQDGQIGHLVVRNASRAKATTAKTIAERANEDKIKGLQDFVERAYTIGTSESAMGIKPNSRNRYLENRDVLMRLGLAQWRNPQNTKAGWVMTCDKDTTYAAIATHVDST